MITNKNNNHCTSKFPLTTILPYTEIAYFPWLFNDFTDFPFSFLISIVSLENSSLKCPFNFLATERVICFPLKLENLATTVLGEVLLLLPTL